MTRDELLALANRLLYACRDPVTGEPLYPGVSSDACVEDVEAAARYLRDCAEAEPVATVRVHDTGGNAGIAWSAVPTVNAGVMRGGTPLYTNPQPTSAQPTLTAEIVEAGTPNMFWDEDPDGDGYVGNTLQEIVEIACDDLTSADGHLYVDVGCARKLPTIAVRAWIDGEGALHWEEVPDTWPWGDE